MDDETIVDSKNAAELPDAGSKNPRKNTASSAYESDILKALFMSTIIPLVLLEISTAGSDFVDGFVISQLLGPQDLAIHGLGSPYYSVTGIVAGLLVTGMQTLSAKAYGAGDKKRAEGFFSMALVTGIVLSVALAFILVFASGPIGEALGATGDSSNLLAGLKAYLSGLAFGTPAIVLVSLLIPIVQMNGGAGSVRISTVVGIVANTVFDIAAGLLGWGMLGIGLATTLARWGQCIVLVVYLIRTKAFIHFGLRNNKWADMGSMVVMGLPKAIRRLANMLRPVFLNHLVLFLGGSAAMSAMSIRNSLDGIGDVMGSGIAAAVMLLVGILYGEENRDGITQICWLALKYIFIAVGALAAAFFIGAPWLANLYATGDANVAELATFAIRCMAVNLVLNAIIEAYINFLQATEQALKTHIVNFASRFACVVACAFIMGSIFGITGVWLAFPVGSLVLMAAIAIATMVKKRSIAITLDDILGLKADFGARPEDALWYSVTSENPVYPIKTQDIYAFCEEHGFERRRAYQTALCLEEMVTNIIEHGFTSDDKLHSIDIRIVAKDDGLILRVRDDCELFNVKEKGELWLEDPDDISKNIGIRMTMASAKDLKYMNTLGANTLLITV